MIEELPNEYDGKAVIGKLDVDNNQESSIKFGVRSIPTLLVFKDGEMLITLGTSGVMIMAMDDFNPMIQHNYLTHAHALENKFILESVVLGVTNIIDWYCSVFNTTIDEFAELTQHENYLLIKN